MNGKQKPTMMLITGATGFIGSRLATLAMQQGIGVKTLTRSDWSDEPAVPTRHRFFGNLPSQIPPAAFDDLDVVVHCAADTGSEEKSSYAVNVVGTERIAQMARAAGASALIFLSSQSARADALSSYGRSKYAAERKLLEVEGLDVNILRLGLVTGAGSRGLFHRLEGMVRKMPVVPLLAGGKSIVQPIHVDEVCEAVFRCCQKPTELNKKILNLGDPEGVSLAEFLQALALARLGHRKFTIPIPLWPAEIAVKIGEALRFALPINSSNLKGLKTVEKMETRESLDELGLVLRPLNEMVKFLPEDPENQTLQDRATKVVLIGAGRVGLVHAVTLSRSSGIKFVGMVDSNPKATALLIGMGLKVPAFRTLQEALVKTKPDAAVIATPVKSHLSLTRECLKNRLAVMVEKPLAIREEQLAEYELLETEFHEHPIQVGYVLTRNPHVIHCLERLKAGCYGTVRHFLGLTLLALIQETNTRRWEVKKDISGGGALINAGGHTLSLIHSAFGDPISLKARSIQSYSTEVEDAMVTEFEYSTFSGAHYCSWSINGFPRQENTLIVWTDQGCLTLTNGLGIFVPLKGQIDIVHQLDFDIGFNMAPDYAGGGFTTEVNDLRKAVVENQTGPMDVKKAIDLERLLFKIYRSARPVARFVDPEMNPTVKSTVQLEMPRPAGSAPGPKLILDLRDLSPESGKAFLEDRLKGSGWDGHLLTSAQLAKLDSRQPMTELKVTVPDFLVQSRLLSTGRYAQVLKEMGPTGVLNAGFAALGVVLTERGVNFWVAAVGLLAASLSAIPHDFAGTILLHVYLTDFALSLRRLDVLEKMLGQCRRARPNAAIGFHTNLAAEALNALWLLETQVDAISVLTSPHALNMGACFGEMRRVKNQSHLNLMAEVGLAPAIVHRVAREEAHDWAFGADAVLLGSAADPILAEQRDTAIRSEWAKAFPGLTMPGAVL